MVVDGELYNHELHDDFSQILSLVRKEKQTEEQKELVREKVQYHVYDLLAKNTNWNFTRRQDVLRDLFSKETPYIVLTRTNFVGSEKGLDELYAAYLADGYEGQMVRVDDVYENKRSKFLMKRKEFVDAEFKILNIVEGKGNWAGYAKTMTFELPNTFDISKSDGVYTCDAGLKGTQEFTKNLLENRDKYIGGEVTIRYFEPPTGYKPRFPVAVAFYENERNM